MPVYVYRNLTTGATFEVEQRISEAALTADPRTGDPVKRVIQPVGIAFKGSGFYVNDSRGKRSASAPAKSSEGDGASKAEAPPPAPTPAAPAASGD
jgi:predicted nucleic acid-binding Zn ribbon protein